MPVTRIYQGEVQRYEILAADGTIDEALADEVRDVLTDEAVRDLYVEMLETRTLDDVAYRMQRSGRMGTFPQNKGQEAGPLGVVLPMVKGRDRLVPSYRESTAMFHLGVPMEKVLLHWLGDERGNDLPAEYGVSPMVLAIGIRSCTGRAWPGASSCRTPTASRSASA